MTEITRVPLPPLAKGSLVKLWIAVIAGLLLAFGIAHATRMVDVRLTVIRDGSGASPTDDDVALVNYVGSLRDGRVFDRGDKVAMPINGVIPGFAKGLKQMKPGGSYRLEIPASLAYGADTKRDATGQVVIPANSDLIFDVTLVGAMPLQQYQQFQQMMMAERMHQMQGAPGGAAPGGDAPAPPPGQ
ncbi:MAG: FKBP-type peptidyl-prolyl cis-trans isomerase [Sphingomonadales bacterium]|nr:FKBP-type peptidyl-prolyl cis-trans isomerase [Sphingomonadales bacterium]